MGEILKIATNVATPLALLGLVAALAYFAYNRRLRHDEKKLESLPEDERARITDEYLTRYGIDGRKLRLADKLALIRDEMDKRHRRSQSYLIVSAVVFVICFGLAVFAYVSKGNSALPDPPGKVLISGPGSNEGYLSEAFTFLSGKYPEYSGMDIPMPDLNDLAKRASGQYLCSAAVTREWTNPMVTVSGIRAGKLEPKVEAYLFAPRGQPELQLHQSTHKVTDGVATLQFKGTLPAQGVVFVVYWVTGLDANPVWSNLSVTLE